VHALPSSTGSGVPGAQVPEPSHVSLPLQALPSEQPVPAGASEWITPVEGLHESIVHGF
jgi:hypothetical protein